MTYKTKNKPQYNNKVFSCLFYFFFFLLPNSIFAQIDVQPLALKGLTSSVVCRDINSLLNVEYKSNTTDQIDLAVTPLRVIVTISGAKSGVLTGESSGGFIYTSDVQTMSVGSTPAFVFDVAGVYTFKIRTTLAGDTNSANDEITVTRTLAPPLSIPFFENCNSDNIYEFRLDEPYPHPCLTSAIEEENGNTFIGMAQGGCGYATFMMPQIGKVRQDDVFSFDYRIMLNYFGDGSVTPLVDGFNYIKVQVSTDCGRTFEDIYRINPSDHIVSNLFMKKTIPLSRFVGQDIKIRFITNNDDPAPFYKVLFQFDNFTINKGNPRDLGVIRKENNTGECDNATQAIKVKIKNYGVQNIDFGANPTTVTAKITGSTNTILTKTLTSGILKPEETLDVRLDGFLNMNILNGTYNAAIFTSLSNDAVPQNDTLKTILKSPRVANPPARALPFNENFDNPTPPTGWILAPLFSEGWKVSQGTGQSGNSLNNIVGYNSILISPRIGTIRVTDRFSIDMKLTNLNNPSEVAVTEWGKCYISVSNDCGYTYEKILTIDKSTLKTGSWTNIVAPLSNFIGQNVLIKIETFPLSDSPYRIDIDNFSVSTSPTIDVGMIELLSPETNCTNNTQSIRLKIKNFSSNALNFANNPAMLTAQISGAVNTSLSKQLNTGILQSGDTLAVTLDGVFNMSIEGDYFIKATINVNNDGFRANDSIFTVKRSPRKIYNLPFEDNFDTLSTFPLGWIQGNWLVKNGTDGVSGKGLTLQMNSSTSTTIPDLYLPILQTVAEYDNLTFRHAITNNSSSGGKNGDVYFEASADCGLTYQILYDAEVYATHGWEEIKIPLSKFIGNPISIRIRSKRYTNENWFFVLDDVTIEPIRPIDIRCDTVYLSEPAPASCGSSARTVKVNISNKGTKDIDFALNPMTITIKMSGLASKTLTKIVNTGTIAVGRRDMAILVDETVNTVDAGTYKFKANVSTVGDITYKNDTSKQSVVLVNPPFATLPYRQNFDTLGLPRGWDLDRWSITEPGSQGSRYVFFSVLDSNFNDKPLTSPLIGKISEGDRLYFDYAVGSTDIDGHTTPAPQGWGYFKVFVSTLCGESYSEIFKVSDSNHVATLNWTTKSVALNAFKGDNVMIRIVPYFGTSSYFLNIDNILVQKAYPVDITPIKILSPLLNCGETEQEVAVEVRNMGTTPLDFVQTPLTTKAIITGRITETLTKIINSGSLAPDGRLVVKFDRKINTLTAGSYTYKIISQVSGDGNIKNDTFAEFTRQITALNTLPLSQNFDSTDIYPINNWQMQGWEVQQFNSRSSGKVIFSPLSYQNTLTLPKLGLVRANDVLDFDYNLGGSAVFIRQGFYTIDIEISEDCGYSFSSDANTRRISFDATNGGGGWLHFNVPLSQYVGKSIIIRFSIIGNEKVETAFDNIVVNNIRQKDVTPTVFFNEDYPPYCGNPRSKWYGTITNSGNETIDLTTTPVTVTAVFTGATTARLSQIINVGSIAPRAGVSFEFELDMSRLGAYYGRLITSMAGDINPLNDSTSMDSLDTRGVAPPFSEDFEGLTIPHSFPGDGWEIITGYGINNGRGIKKGLNIDKTTGYIDMPQIGNIRNGDSLSLDLRILSLSGQPLSSPWGNIKVKVSTDCNATFTDIYTIDRSNYITSDWSRLNLSLSRFAGQSVVIRYELNYIPSADVAGFYAYFDNFNVKGTNDAPINDNCTTAIVLNQYPNGHQGTTVKATATIAPTPNCSNTPINDVWYKIITPTDIPPLTKVNIVLENVQIGAVINYAIFKGSCDMMRQLDSTGLCGSTTTGTTLFLKNLEQGQTYYLRLWSKTATEAGKFTVRFGSSIPASLISIANANTPACRPLSIIDIRQDNNNVWVPIMDGNDIVSEIKANGNNLGRVQADYFINKTGTIRRASNVPFLDRNVGIKPDTQPRSPVAVRIYLTAAEWTALRAADPSVSDTSFSLTRVSNQTCTNSFTAITGSQINDAFIRPFNGGFYIQFNTPQFSQFFINNNKGALKLNTAASDLSNQKIQIYPIPTGGLLNVEVETQSLEDIKLEVIDLLGRVVRQQTPKTTSIGVNYYSLDLTNLSDGSYILVLTSKNGKKITKVIKQAN